MNTVTRFHLAQINVSWLLKALDHADNDDFRASLEPVNRIADASPGFIWRMMSSYGDATEIRAFEDPLILVNISVWESVDLLSEYVLGAEHLEVMRKRRKWFARPPQAHLALWWIPAGHTPSVSEAVARLEHLREHGESEHAFTIKRSFPAPTV